MGRQPDGHPPTGQELECPLVKLIEPRLRSPLFELDVTEPALN